MTNDAPTASDLLLEADELRKTARFARRCAATVGMAGITWAGTAKEMMADAAELDEEADRLAATAKKIAR